MGTAAGASHTPGRWHPRQREAKFFAELLRNSRLVLLFGEAGAGRTTLLEREVLPLLQQGVEALFGGEVALVFSDWNEAPLSALSAAIRKQFQASVPLTAGDSDTGWYDVPLVDELESLGREHGISFLLIFDQFERYLEQPADSGEGREFDDVFVDLVTRRSLRTNVLVSLRDDSEPLMLARFGDRVTGLGDARLRLPPWFHATPAQQILRDEPDPLPIAAPFAHALATGAQRFDWKQGATAAPMPVSIPEAIPAQRARSLSDQPPTLEPTLDPVTWSGPEMLARGLLHADPVVQRSIAIELTGPEPPQPPPIPISAETLQGARSDRLPPLYRADNFDPQTRGRDRLLKWLPLPLTAAALALLIWTQWRTASGPAAVVSVESTPSAAVAVTAAPARMPLTLVADADSGSGSLIAADLATKIAPEAGLDLRVVQAGDAIGDLYRLGESGSAPAALAIVQYDVLQLMRRQAAQGEPRARRALETLRMVAPLQSDEVLFIVRADSPLRYVHELRGKTINVGPAASGGSVTAAAVYRLMFGEAPGRAAYLTHAEALRKMLDERSIDAVALVGAAPAALLTKQEAAIKTLEIDRDHPASRRAVKAYLPTTIRAQDHPGWLKKDVAGLSVMSFLVTTASDDAETSQRIGALAKAMCDQQATLRGSGHPKWRDVPTGLDLNARWSVLAVADGITTACNAT